MGRIVDLTLPRLGETMEQGRIVAWLKRPGDSFRRGETLLEVETDKTVVEVPALADGTLIETLAAADETIAVECPIGRIELAAQADPAGEAAPSAPAATPGATEVVEFLMPRLGETMEEGRIVAWLAPSGHRFKRGETLLEVETDKTVVEVPALQDGILVAPLVSPDAVVAVGAPLARIEILAGRAAGRPTAAPPSAAAAPARPATTRLPRPTGEANGRIAATPVARRLARTAGIDLSGIVGSGRRGWISGDDVRARLTAEQPLPEGHHRVETSRGAVAVRTLGAAGRAVPVVLLHGLFGDADTWAEVARRVAEAGHPVHAIDLPGHGRTPIDEADLDEVAAIVSASLAKLAPGRLRLAGHSLGALLATKVAAGLPARVDRLVLSAPAGIGRDLGRAFVDDMLAVRSGDDLRGALRHLGANTKVLSAEWLDGQAANLAERRPALAALAGALLEGGEQRVDIRPLLAVSEARVSVLMGTSDTVVPVAQAQSLPPAVAVHFVQGAGHMPHWAQPALFARLITA